MIFRVLRQHCVPRSSPVRLGMIAYGLVLLMATGCRSTAAQDLASLEEQAFREAAANAAPSIVRIETVGGFDRVGKLLTGTGPTTGVVVGADGWIISSLFNFVSRPSAIFVTVPDEGLVTPGDSGNRFPAELVATDEVRKLALLKIDASGLKPLEFPERETIRVGNWAIALGRTYDQPFPSISVGLVAALDRFWGRAIQTDAKVSPVNYGGPLVDITGKGMGILVPLSPQSDEETAGVEWYDSGIGFAIPLEDVYAILPRLQEGNDLKPGLIGVTFQSKGPLAGEARVDRVRVQSPAEQAGLNVGDIILEANGTPVERLPHLQRVLGPLYAGDELDLKVRREEETVAISLTLAAELPPYEPSFLGILPERVASDETSGTRARYVFDDSPAREAGIGEGDVVTTVNGVDVATAAELRDQISRYRPGEAVRLTVQSGGDEVIKEVTLAAKTGIAPEGVPPAPDAPSDEAAAPQAGIKTGRIVQTHPETDQRYWAYVPESFTRQAGGPGLVLWLHPASDTKESLMLRLWREECERRGLIFAAPYAREISGWTLQELEPTGALLRTLVETYGIDQTRIAVMGGGEGARFAYMLAFRERELVRGMAALAGPVAEEVPANDPDEPLQFYIGLAGEANQADLLRNSAGLLEKAKYPTYVRETEGTLDDLLAPSVTEEIAAWVDILDRI